MFFDRNKAYYYVAYLADGGGSYSFQLGLFGGRSKYSESTFPDIVRNEKQKISVVADVSPSGQVMQSTHFELARTLLCFP